MNKIFTRLSAFTFQQVLIFGAILGGAYYFTLYDDGADLQTKIISTKANIEQEQAKKRDTDAVLKEATQMKAAVGALSQEYQEISRRLPTNLSSIELNRNIDSYAHDSGVSIKSRRPMAVIPGEIVDGVPVEISLEGSFAELAQFVYLAALSERAVTLDSYTMEAGTDPKISKLKFKAVIVGYQLGTLKPPPKPGDPTPPPGVTR